jgi:hypothetical protein
MPVFVQCIHCVRTVRNKEQITSNEGAKRPENEIPRKKSVRLPQAVQTPQFCFLNVSANSGYFRNESIRWENVDNA